MAQKTSARKIASLDLKRKILEARREKMTYEQIAEKVGCDKSYCFKVVQAWIDEVNAQTLNKTESMIVQMQSDIEQLVADYWPTRTNPDSAKIILKALDQLAKLRGLNAAEKLDLTHSMPTKIEYVVDE